MPRKRIGEIELAWEDEGQGFPVVLLHAFPLNKNMWAEQKLALAHRYRLIAPDFRGHGESTVVEEDSTMEQLADDLRALLDELSLDKVVLGGLSMGGYASLAFYRKYGKRVAALILADTRATADTEEARQGRYELAAVAEKEGAAAVADRMLPKLLGETTHRAKPSVVDRVRQMIVSTPPQGIVGALRGLADRPDSTPLLPRIHCPVLVLVGSEDVLTPPAEAEAMARAIPQAELEIIPAAGHLSNLEQPEVFTRLLADFLFRLSAATCSPSPSSPPIKGGG
jgi:pimeloyl-ACP methyl ester carboxylesterase